MSKTSTESSPAKITGEPVEFMEELEPTNYYPLRYRLHNGLEVGFRPAACDALQKFKINPERLLKQLHGVPLLKYRNYGVWMQYRPERKHMKIIVVWKVGGKEPDEDFYTRPLHRESKESEC